MHVELKGNLGEKKNVRETVWVLLNVLTLKTWHKVFAEHRFQTGPLEMSAVGWRQRGLV